MAFRYKRAVPSQINSSLQRREVNAAFISSIHSPGFKCTDLGIIARGKVYSVFIIPKQSGDDPASETSNRLARILELEGRVLIGDAALKYYLNGGEGVDLAQEWHKRTGLPFVFARLCYNKYNKKVESLAKNFINQRIKIPQYILKKEAKERGISPKQLAWYLRYIHYTLDWKAKRSLKLFLDS